MEQANGLTNNSMYGSVGVGLDSTLPPGGVFNGDNGINHSKKLKLDSEPQVLPQNGPAFAQSGG